MKLYDCEQEAQDDIIDSGQKQMKTTFDKTTFGVGPERIRPMRNFRTSKYKKPDYFVQKWYLWEVVEFPTNDIVRVCRTKIDAEVFSEQIKKNRPFGDIPLPNFIKSSRLDIVE